MSITGTFSNESIAIVLVEDIFYFYSGQTSDTDSGLSQLAIESIVFCTYISSNTLCNALIDKT